MESRCKSLHSFEWKWSANEQREPILSLTSPCWSKKAVQQFYKINWGSSASQVAQLSPPQHDADQPTSFQKWAGKSFNNGWIFSLISVHKKFKENQRKQHFQEKLCFRKFKYVHFHSSFLLLHSELPVLSDSRQNYRSMCMFLQAWSPTAPSNMWCSLRKRRISQMHY